MKKALKTKLVKDLTLLMPESPAKTLKKDRSAILKQLLQLRPAMPFKKADGPTLLAKLNIPAKPN